MALFSELITQIKADNKDFIKKVDESKGAISKFSKEALKIGAIATGVIAGTATIAFGSLLHVINNTTEEISALVDTANRLGGTVAGFQKLQYAAKLSGVSTEELNQGLKKLAQTVVSANSGSEKAANAFKSMGLNAKELSKLSLDEQYIKVAEALGGISDKAKQTELSLAIFGRTGITQLSLIRDGVKQATDDFDKFGGALTDKQASAVDAYGDSLDRLSAIFDAFKIQLTAAVAPALETFVKWIGDSVLAMGGLGEAGKQAGLFIVDGIILGVKAFQGLLNFVDSIITKFKELKLAALQVAQTFDNLGFAITGGEINFERGLEMAKLQKDISGSGKGKEFTSGLQNGLQGARNALVGAGSNQKGTIDVNIQAGDGLKAEVAESPEVTKMINLMIRKTMADEANATR